jgi:hypothetical protein
MIRYFKLNDNKHKNVIVKADGRIQHRYDKKKGWIRTGIMLDYFSDESDTYDMYEEIKESEAFKLIGEKSA